jgi:hypothetical protein
VCITIIIKNPIAPNKNMPETISIPPGLTHPYAIKEYLLTMTQSRRIREERESASQIREMHQFERPASCATISRTEEEILSNALARQGLYKAIDKGRRVNPETIIDGLACLAYKHAVQRAG